MLARRLPGIMPALTPEQAAEIRVTHSMAGMAYDFAEMYQIRSVDTSDVVRARVTTARRA
jgi:predicted ATPase with chaperone activity